MRSQKYFLLLIIMALTNISIDLYAQKADAEKKKEELILMYKSQGYKEVTGMKEIKGSTVSYNIWQGAPASEVTYYDPAGREDETYLFFTGTIDPNNPSKNIPYHFNNVVRKVMKNGSPRYVPMSANMVYGGYGFGDFGYSGLTGGGLPNVSQPRQVETSGFNCLTHSYAMLLSEKFQNRANKHAMASIRSTNTTLLERDLPEIPGRRSATRELILLSIAEEEPYYRSDHQPEPQPDLYRSPAGVHETHMYPNDYVATFLADYTFHITKPEKKRYGKDEYRAGLVYGMVTPRLGIGVQSRDIYRMLNKRGVYFDFEQYRFNIQNPHREKRVEVQYTAGGKWGNVYYFFGGASYEPAIEHIGMADDPTYDNGAPISKSRWSWTTSSADDPQETGISFKTKFNNANPGNVYETTLEVGMMNAEKPDLFFKNTNGRYDFTVGQNSGFNIKDHFLQWEDHNVGLVTGSPTPDKPKTTEGEVFIVPIDYRTGRDIGSLKPLGKYVRRNKEYTGAVDITTNNGLMQASELGFSDPDAKGEHWFRLNIKTSANMGAVTPVELENSRLMKIYVERTIEVYTLTAANGLQLLTTQTGIGPNLFTFTFPKEIDGKEWKSMTPSLPSYESPANPNNRTVAVKFSEVSGNRVVVSYVDEIATKISFRHSDNKDTRIFQDIDTDARQLVKEETHMALPNAKIVDFIGTLITGGKIAQKNPNSNVLNFPGYKEVSVMDYEVYKNGAKVTPKPTTISVDTPEIVFFFTGKQFDFK